MKHLLKRSLSLLLAAVLLLCAGCASEPRDERLSIDYATRQMERQVEEETMLYMRLLTALESYRPLYADETLLDALRLSEWVECDQNPLAENPPEFEPFTEEYEQQRRLLFVLEHADESSFYLEIGTRYGAIFRKDDVEGVKENGVPYTSSEYHSAVCFTLPQTEEGEMVDALRDLSQRYIDETDWWSID